MGPPFSRSCAGLLLCLASALVSVWPGSRVWAVESTSQPSYGSSSPPRKGLFQGHRFEQPSIEHVLTGELGICPKWTCSKDPSQAEIAWSFSASARQLRWCLRRFHRLSGLPRYAWEGRKGPPSSSLNGLFGTNCDWTTGKVQLKVGRPATCPWLYPSN